MQDSSREGGFTFVELLAVVLLLGILVLVALPNYFGAENEARITVDKANVRAINAALALYRFKNNNNCPTSATFASFLADTAYFPDGVPTDPNDPDNDGYAGDYQASICRVVIDP